MSSNTLLAIETRGVLVEDGSYVLAFGEPGFEEPSAMLAEVNDEYNVGTVLDSIYEAYGDIEIFDEIVVPEDEEVE